MVFDALRLRPVTTIKDLSKRAGICFTTCARHLDALSKLGIVREITGRSRECVFSYQAYLEILNEGAEPFS